MNYSENERALKIAQAVAKSSCAHLAQACDLLAIVKATQYVPQAQIDTCRAELERCNVLILETLMRLD